MRRKYYIAIALIVILTTGCHHTSITGVDYSDKDVKKIKIYSGTLDFYADPASIVSGEINSDILGLVVRYGGGCKDHDFELYWDGLFMDSEPPQVRLQLSHNANNDLCRALLTEKLFFNLSPIKERFLKTESLPPALIIVNIHEPDTTNNKQFTVHYRFKP